MAESLDKIKCIAMRIQGKVLSCLLIVILLLPLACAEKRDKAETYCDISAGPCLKQLDHDGMRVVFDITPKPVKSMAELLFSVDLKKGVSQVKNASVSVDLTMPGMFMGTNRPVLKQVKDGRYEGKGFIMKCPSGNKIWKSEVHIEHAGETILVNYTFEVRD